MGSINPIAAVAQQMLLGSAVRQNHALEHATIVLLSRKFPDVRMAGISFAPAGFAAKEVQRLQEPVRSHRNCGRLGRDDRRSG